MSKSLSVKYSIALIAIFILLALLVGKFPINIFDLTISRYIQQLHTDWLDQLMVIVSKMGDIAFAVAFMLIAAFLFFIFRFKRETIFILAISGTGLVTFILKRIFSRARPSEEHVTLIDVYHNHSFPSGHTLSYVVFFGFLIFLMHQLKTLPKNLSLGVKVFSYFMLVAGPISRIYLGAHWFTDILGGIIIGILYLQVLTYYYKKGLKKEMEIEPKSYPHHLN